MRRAARPRRAPGVRVPAGDRLAAAHTLQSRRVCAAQGQVQVRPCGEGRLSRPGQGHRLLRRERAGAGGLPQYASDHSDEANDGLPEQRVRAGHESGYRVQHPQRNAQEGQKAIRGDTQGGRGLRGGRGGRDGYARGRQEPLDVDIPDGRGDLPRGIPGQGQGRHRRHLPWRTPQDNPRDRPPQGLLRHERQRPSDMSGPPAEKHHLLRGTAARTQLAQANADTAEGVHTPTKDAGHKS